MPDPSPEALEFLLSRRSRPAKTLTDAAPDKATLRAILTAAARTPDHGKLQPFRFIVLTGEARARASAAVRAGMEAEGAEPATIDKQANAMRQGGVIVTVVVAPVPSPKVPEWEQHLAAGGACLACLNAALASGWGANWLTGWAAQSRWFMEGALDLAPHESVAGFIHIGGETIAPQDRPRPDLDQITTWVSA